MSRLSFFYKSPAVYKITLRALERRQFVILEADENQGVIKAETKKGFLKPSVSMELKINAISENQTAMDIQSGTRKSWITPDGYEAKAEQKFINTLYKCFENL